MFHFPISILLGMIGPWQVVLVLVALLPIALIILLLYVLLRKKKNL